jgi:hypothetical protein
MMSEEVWKDIPDYEGYQASNLGNIRSVDRKVKNSNGREYYVKGTSIKKTLSKNGYYVVRLTKAKLERFVHRLVGFAFIPNPENKPQINHINGVKTDNRLENLEWCTNRENIEHARVTGLKYTVLNKDQVFEIRYGLKGYKHREIGQMYNINPSLVSYIRLGKIWKDV